MKSIVALGLVLLLQFIEGCEDSCWFVYDNREGTQTTTELWDKTTTGPDKKLSGVFIIQGFFKTDGQSKDFDFLRFRYLNDGKIQALILNYEKTDNRWKIFGEANGVYENYVQYITDVAATGDFRFKFTTMTSDKITITYTDSKKAKEELLFTYNDNWSTWKFKQNGMLSDSTNIVSDLFETNYKYILGCPTNTPTMCQPLKPLKYVLDKQYKLTCTGSGSPPLTVVWTSGHDKPKQVINEAISSANTTRLTGTEHILTSTLTIPSFNVDYIGQYTCTITSTDAGALAKAETSWDLSYSEELIYSTNSPSALDKAYYLKSDTNMTGNLTVTGWPLDDVQFNTSLHGPADVAVYVDNLANPPSKTFTISKEQAITQESFNVTVFKISTNAVLKNYDIVMVGAACVAGQYGVGIQCKTCPSGTNSVAKSDDIDQCITVTSNCEEGYWGVDNSCSKCPEGKTSEAKSVKSSDCFTPAVNPQPSKDGPNLGLLVGVIIAGALVIIIIIIILIRCIRAKMMRTTTKEPAPEPSKSGSFVISNRPAADAHYETEPSRRGFSTRLPDPEDALNSEHTESVTDDLYDNNNLKKETPSVVANPINESNTYIELDRTVIRTRSNTSGTSDKFEKKNHRKLTINEGRAGEEDNYTSIQADKPERKGRSGVKESSLDA